MKITAVLDTTASEPLTLEEEYEMQKSWHLDEDSTPILLSLLMHLIECTFIILSPKFESPHTNGKFENGSMIGDVNLFLLAIDCPEMELFEPGITSSR